MPKPLKAIRHRISRAEPPVELDAIDSRLLIELVRDARIPQRKLADLLGLSAPAVADRITRLKARGVIRGYSAVLDWERLGNSVTAHLTLIATLGADLDATIEQLSKIRGVEEISSITGAADLIVKVRAQSFDDLRRVIFSEVSKVKNLQRTETSLSFLTVAPEGATEKMLEFLTGPDNGLS